MQVTINNNVIKCNEKTTIISLLEQLKQSHIGFAIALNKKIIPREQWKFHQIRDGDHILLFQVVAGG